MNPMMMMMMPQLMEHMHSQSSENPMSGFLMASLMKKMTSSSSSQSDYDYDYDYDYAYDYSNGPAGSAYDYDYQDAAPPSPSPLSSIIQQMLQQKLGAAQTPLVQLTMTPTVNSATDLGVVESSESTDSSEGNVDAQPANVEIAPPTHVDKEIRPSEQVSYRNAP